MSTPLFTCRCACTALPASAATFTPCSCAWSMTSFGGDPSALAISLIGCASAISTCRCATSSVQPSTPCGLLALRQRRQVEALHQLVDVAPVVRVDHRADLGQHLVGVGAVHVDRLLRHHGVDAVGLAVHVLVDPVELDLELLGAEADRAEHTEPAGLAHRGDDVAAVGEGEDRVLDPEHVAQRGSHLALRSRRLLERVLRTIRHAGPGLPSPRRGSPYRGRTPMAMPTKQGFPPGFDWGTATAAHQIEGANVNNDWWAWEHAPGSPCAESSGDACDSWHRWPDDVAVVADLGLDARTGSRSNGAASNRPRANGREPRSTTTAASARRCSNARSRRW